MSKMEVQSCCEFQNGEKQYTVLSYVVPTRNTLEFIKNEKNEAEKEMKIVQSEFNAAREKLARAQRKFEVVNTMLKYANSLMFSVKEIEVSE